MLVWAVERFDRLRGWRVVAAFRTREAADKAVLHLHTRDKPHRVVRL